MVSQKAFRATEVAEVGHVHPEHRECIIALSSVIRLSGQSVCEIHELMGNEWSSGLKGSVLLNYVYGGGDGGGILSSVQRVDCLHDMSSRASRSSAVINDSSSQPAYSWVSR